MCKAYHSRLQTCFHERLVEKSVSFKSTTTEERIRTDVPVIKRDLLQGVGVYMLDVSLLMHADGLTNGSRAILQVG